MKTKIEQKLTEKWKRKMEKEKHYGCAPWLSVLPHSIFNMILFFAGWRNVSRHSVCMLNGYTAYILRVQCCVWRTANAERYSWRIAYTKPYIDYRPQYLLLFCMFAGACVYHRDDIILPSSEFIGCDNFNDVLLKHNVNRMSFIPLQQSFGGQKITICTTFALYVRSRWLEWTIFHFGFAVVMSWAHSGFYFHSLLQKNVSIRFGR